jgi:hypothetical protein
MAKKSRVYTGTEWIDIASSTTDLSNYANMTTTPISGFRNAIINGDFGINQRGFTSLTTDGAYGFDRWLTYASSGGTYSAPAFTPGAAPVSGYEGKNFYRIVTTGQSGAGVYTSFEQRIEDVRTFAGQTVTVSFWAKAASGTPKVSIEFIQQFGSGGSSATLTNASAVTLSTSWARYSVSVAIPSISGKTIGTNPYLTCAFWVSAGTTFAARTNSIGIQSNTFDFWGVQVEKGTIATPLEQRPIATELLLCQRYYEKSFALNQTPANGLYTNFYLGIISYDDLWTLAIPNIPFKVEKRGVPTITFYGTSNNWQFYNSNETYTTWGNIYTSNIRGLTPVNSKSFGVGAYPGGSSGLPVGSARIMRGDWTAESEL